MVGIGGPSPDVYTPPLTGKPEQQQFTIQSGVLTSIFCASDWKMFQIIHFTLLKANIIKGIKQFIIWRVLTLPRCITVQNSQEPPLEWMFVQVTYWPFFHSSSMLVNKKLDHIHTHTSTGDGYPCLGYNKHKFACISMAAFTLIQVHYEFNFHSYGSFRAGLVSRQPVRVSMWCYLFIQHTEKIWRTFDVNITLPAYWSKLLQEIQGTSQFAPNF